VPTTTPRPADRAALGGPRRERRRGRSRPRRPAADHPRDRQRRRNRSRPNRSGCDPAARRGIWPGLRRVLPGGREATWNKAPASSGSACTLVIAFLIAVTDDRHHRHDHASSDGERPTSPLLQPHSSRRDVRDSRARRADGHALHRDFVRHAQHPRIHRGDIDFRIGCVDRPRAPLRRDEVEVAELTMVIERASPAATLTMMRSPAVPRHSGRWPAVASAAELSPAGRAGR
jgi:hypothetical protein